MDEQIKEVKEKIVPILRQHDVVRAGLFGSLVRQEIRVDSDIDLLIELRPDKSLFDLVALKLDLEDILGRSVDLVEYLTLHPRLSAKILQEEVRVL